MKKLIRLLVLTGLVVPAPLVLAATFEPPPMSSDLPPNASLDEMRAKAEKGDALAQLELGEPYLGSDAPEPNQPSQKPSFEDMVSKAQQSVVLILCY